VIAEFAQQQRPLVHARDVTLQHRCPVDQGHLRPGWRPTTVLDQFASKRLKDAPLL
jgi:hypothetical protein